MLSFFHLKLSTIHAVISGLDDERQLSVFTRLACGAIAGTTGQTVAYPLDVVRRRLQVHVPYLAHILSVRQLATRKPVLQFLLRLEDAH